MKGLAIATMGLLAFALVTGCGPKETTISDGSGRTVTTSEDGSARMTITSSEGKMEFSSDGDKGKLTVESKDGSLSVGANNVGDADLGVPVYPGATKRPGEDMKGDSPSESTSLARFTTPDPPSVVGDFYRSRLVKSSRSTFEADGTDTVLISGKADDRTDVVITIARAKDATESTITIATTRKK